MYVVCRNYGTRCYGKMPGLWLSIIANIFNGLNKAVELCDVCHYIYRQTSNIRHQIPKLWYCSSSLAVVFAWSYEARCLVENEDVIGATGDAPIASDWSKILLPIKVRLICRYMYLKWWGDFTYILQSTKACGIHVFHFFAVIWACREWNPFLWITLNHIIQNTCGVGN